MLELVGITRTTSVSQVLLNSHPENANLEKQLILTCSSVNDLVLLELLQVPDPDLAVQ